MSSPRAARMRATRHIKAAQAPTTTPSITAMRLAATVDRELAEGRPDVLTPKAVQALMAAACNAYAAQIEAGGNYPPLIPPRRVNDSAVMLTVSALLRAANLEVFELAMWQSWTGR